jgi:hypothetical protein
MVTWVKFTKFCTSSKKIGQDSIMVTITGNNNARGNARRNARGRGHISMISNNVLRQIIGTSFTPREIARLREVSKQFKGVINRNRTLLPGRGANYIQAHDRALQEMLRLVPILNHYQAVGHDIPANLAQQMRPQRQIARTAYNNLLKFIGRPAGPYTFSPALSRQRRIRNVNNFTYNSNNENNVANRIRRRKARQFALKYLN